MAVLEVKDLHKSYGKQKILNGVNLSIEKGEVLVLLGRSGTGKSTLLRCIHLLEDFEQGWIILNGEFLGYEPINGHRRSVGARKIAKQRAKIGMVFQQFALFPHLTVLGNVTLGLVRVKSMPWQQAIQKAEAALQMVGMWEKRNAYPVTLSGGQQQRVAIARALVMEPILMLFDEPTSALDPELVNGVLELMKQIAAQGMTMIVVTHEIPFARDVASRVAFMHEGKIVEIGPPHQIFSCPTHPETVAFLSSILRTNIIEKKSEGFHEPKYS